MNNIFLLIVTGLIATGALLMFFSAVRTSQIKTLLAQQDGITSAANIKNWQSLATLMRLFIGGYCLAIYLIAFNHLGWLVFLTSSVFFAGSLFVLISVNLYSRTLKQLTTMHLQYRAQRDKAAAALSQLQHVQREQAQLVHKEKMMSLGQLAAGIAHEINNPIGFIYSNLGPVRQYSEDLLALIDAYQNTNEYVHPEIEQLAEEIDLDFISSDLLSVIDSMEVGAKRIRHIVNSTRAFVRLDEARYKRADIHEGIESTLAMLRPQLEGTLPSQRIKVKKHYAVLPEVACDHSAMNQVFFQLIKNSIDAFLYTEKAYHVAVISLKTRQIDNDWIEIEIADNGSGITKESLKHIFDPFYTTKPVGQGTGLGLSISHKVVVEQHQGKLLVQPKAEGTICTVTLPINRTCSSLG